METFDFLCSVCKFANAIACEQHFRRSVDFPMLTSDISSYPFPEQEAVVAVPINDATVFGVASLAITYNDLNVHTEMVEFIPELGKVNKLLYVRALALIDKVYDDIDAMLAGTYKERDSNTSLGQNEVSSAGSQHQMTPSPFQRLSTPSPGRIMRSANSVISLAKIYIGGKLFRMHRFSTSFFDDTIPLVVFTGFRMAGAIAEMIACMVKHKYRLRLTVKVVTFGSPCAGDSEYNMTVQNYMQRHYKVALQHDGLASKSFGGGYKQPNQIVRIHRKGHYAVNNLLCCYCKDNYCSINEYILAIRTTMQIDGNRTIVGCVTNASDDDDLKRL